MSLTLSQVYWIRYKYGFLISPEKSYINTFSYFFISKTYLRTSRINMVTSLTLYIYNIFLSTNTYRQKKKKNWLWVIYITSSIIMKNNFILMFCQIRNSEILVIELCLKFTQCWYLAPNIQIIWLLNMRNIVCTVILNRKINKYLHLRSYALNFTGENVIELSHLKD